MPSNVYKKIYFTWTLANSDRGVATNQAHLMQYLLPESIIYIFEVSEIKDYPDNIITDYRIIATLVGDDFIPFTPSYPPSDTLPPPDDSAGNIGWVMEHNLWNVIVTPSGAPSSITSSFVSGKLAKEFALHMSTSTNGTTNLVRNNRPRMTFNKGSVIGSYPDLLLSNDLTELTIWKDLL